MRGVYTARSMTSAELSQPTVLPDATKKAADFILRFVTTESYTCHDICIAAEEAGNDMSTAIEAFGELMIAKAIMVDASKGEPPAFIRSSAPEVLFLQ